MQRRPQAVVINPVAADTGLGLIVNWPLVVCGRVWYPGGWSRLMNRRYDAVADPISGGSPLLCFAAVRGRSQSQLGCHLASQTDINASSALFAWSLIPLAHTDAASASQYRHRCWQKQTASSSSISPKQAGC